MKHVPKDDRNAAAEARSVSDTAGTVEVVLGLGSNLPSRVGYLQRAVRMLRTEEVLCTQSLRVSSLYVTPALVPQGAPEDWHQDFMNQAVWGKTTLSPVELLHTIKRVEQSLGRQPRARWAPREIDIDILVYGPQVWQDAQLHVPHVGLLQRRFALYPLAELWPEWRYPHGTHAGETACSLMDGCCI